MTFWEKVRARYVVFTNTRVGKWVEWLRKRIWAVIAFIVPATAAVIYLSLIPGGGETDTSLKLDLSTHATVKAGDTFYITATLTVASDGSALASKWITFLHNFNETTGYRYQTNASGQAVLTVTAGTTFATTEWPSYGNGTNKAAHHSFQVRFEGDPTYARVQDQVAIGCGTSGQTRSRMVFTTAPVNWAIGSAQTVAFKIVDDTTGATITAGDRADLKRAVLWAFGSIYEVSMPSGVGSVSVTPRFHGNYKQNSIVVINYGGYYVSGGANYGGSAAQYTAVLADKPDTYSAAQPHLYTMREPSASSDAEAVFNAFGLESLSNIADDPNWLQGWKTTNAANTVLQADGSMPSRKIAVGISDWTTDECDQNSSCLRSSYSAATGTASWSGTTLTGWVYHVRYPLEWGYHTAQSTKTYVVSDTACASLQGQSVTEVVYIPVPKYSDATWLSNYKAAIQAAVTAWDTDDILAAWVPSSGIDDEWQWKFNELSCRCKDTTGSYQKHNIIGAVDDYVSANSINNIIDQWNSLSPAPTKPVYFSGLHSMELLKRTTAFPLNFKCNQIGPDTDAYHGYAWLWEGFSVERDNDLEYLYNLGFWGYQLFFEQGWGSVDVVPSGGDEYAESRWNGFRTVAKAMNFKPSGVALGNPSLNTGATDTTFYNYALHGLGTRINTAGVQPSIVLRDRILSEDDSLNSPVWGNFTNYLYQLDNVSGGKTTTVAYSALTTAQKNNARYSSLAGVPTDLAESTNYAYNIYSDSVVARRFDHASGNDHMYFNVDDGYPYAQRDHSELSGIRWYFKVTALNAGTGDFKLCYPTADDGSTETCVTFTTSSDNLWEEYQTEVLDAHMKNGFSGGADFYLDCNADGNDIIVYVEAYATSGGGLPATSTATAVETATDTPVPGVATATDTPAPAATSTPTATRTPTIPAGHPTPGGAWYYPDKDSMLDGWNATTNYGTNGEIYLHTSGNQRNVLSFDLSSINAGSTVTSAKLVVYRAGWAAARDNTTITAYQVIRDWVEAQTTWNIAKTAVSWGTAGCDNTTSDRSATAAGSVAVTDATGWSAIDITDLVQDWVTTPANNEGLILILTADATNSIVIKAKETTGTDYDPYLEIVYTSPTATPTATNTPTATPTPAGSGTIQGTGVEDTRGNGGAATTNYATATLIYIRSDNWSAGLLYFPMADTIPSGATNVSATASLYAYARSGTDKSFRFRPMRRYWIDTEATFNIARTGVNWGTAMAASTTSDTFTDYVDTNTLTGVEQWASADIASILTSHDEINLPQQNLGLRFAQADSADVNYSFYSTEHATTTLRPKLVLTWTDPTFVKQEGVSSYAGTTDTWLDSANATTNYGGDATMTASSTGNVLVKFDVSSIPAGQVVSGAWLQLKTDSAIANPATIEVYPVTRSWSEAQATWTESATGVNWSTAGAGSSDRGAIVATGTISRPGWIAWDITALVQSWVDSPSSNYGVVLDHTGGDAIAFITSEDATSGDRPRISVNYSAPTPTPVPTATGTPVPADYSLTITDGNTTIGAGEQITWTVVITNSGDSESATLSLEWSSYLQPNSMPPSPIDSGAGSASWDIPGISGTITYTFNFTTSSPSAGTYNLWCRASIGSMSDSASAEDSTTLSVSTPTPTATPVSQLYINEVSPNPVDAKFCGSTACQWIEVFNGGLTTVDLRQYRLVYTDTNGLKETYTFGENVTSLAGRGYIVVYQGRDFDAMITSTGRIILTAPGGATVDSMTYGSVTADVSYARVCDGCGSWAEQEHPTIGRTNGGATPTPTGTPYPTGTPTRTPTPQAISGGFSGGDPTLLWLLLPILILIALILAVRKGEPDVLAHV